MPRATTPKPRVMPRPAFGGRMPLTLPNGMPIPTKVDDPLERFGAPATVTGSDHPIPLISTDIQVRITGGIALVKTTRLFRNTEAESIEATITFPVPVHATVLDLEARIADRVLTGKAQRKQQARATYEAALDDGKSAVLHEEVIRGIHMLSVGHVPPGADILVTCLWAVPLVRLDADAALLRIPTTVGDIFGVAPMPDSDAPTHGPQLHHAELSVEAIGCEAVLLQGTLTQGKARVALNAPIDLSVRGLPAVSTLEGTGRDGRMVRLTVGRPEASTALLDGAVLVDHSGSMRHLVNGSSETGISRHDVVRAGLEAASSVLDEGDVLDIWEFNHTPKPVGRVTSPAELTMGARRLAAPSGNTRLGHAIDTLMQARPQLKDILVISDGDTWSVDVGRLARTGVRFHVVLVGENSLEAVAGQLAALTGGELFLVSGQDAQNAVTMGIAAMRRLHVANPVTLKDGNPLKVVQTMGGMLVTAEWGVPSVARSLEASSERAEDKDISRAVAALAAGLALRHMEDEVAGALAEAEGLVTHLTSLVLVDEAAEKQDGIPHHRKVLLSQPVEHFAAQAMPAGVQSAFRRAPAGIALRASGAGGGFMPASSIDFMANVAAPTRGTGQSLPRMESAATPGDGGGLDIPRFLRPQREAAQPSTTTLSQLKGKVNWNDSPTLRGKGELKGLDPYVVTALIILGKNPEVEKLASPLLMKGAALVLGLLALLDAEAGDRQAGRVAAKLLKAVPEAQRKVLITALR